MVLNGCWKPQNSFLEYTASTAVYQVPSVTAWLFFGTICALLALTATCSQHKTRKAKQDRIALMEWQEMAEELTPEQTGRVMREVLAKQDDGSGTAMKIFLQALEGTLSEDGGITREESLELHLEKEARAPKVLKDEASEKEPAKETVKDDTPGAETPKDAVKEEGSEGKTEKEAVGDET